MDRGMSRIEYNSDGAWRGEIGNKESRAWTCWERVWWIAGRSEARSSLYTISTVHVDG